MTRDYTTVIIRLTYFERSFLVMLSQRGGETRFNHNLVAPHVVGALKALCGKLVVTEVPVIGHPGESYYRLTDTGRTLVGSILAGAGNPAPKT